MLSSADRARPKPQVLGLKGRFGLPGHLKDEVPCSEAAHRVAAEMAIQPKAIATPVQDDVLAVCRQPPARDRPLDQDLEH